MTTQSRNALIALMLMLATAATAWAITPTYRIAQERPINIEESIPKKFGEWRMDSTQFSGVVNPQQTELLNKLYSQTLSRIYINERTEQRVMLSIAYGEDQRDGMQLHYPEVCYPAQGFEVLSNQVGTVESEMGVIPVRRLRTVLNKTRFEPVTYWTMIGERAVLGGVRKKISEMHYGLRGQIVDGLLFRISSIDQDAAGAFDLQRNFAIDLLSEIKPAQRKRLSGLN